MGSNELMVRVKKLEARRVKLAALGHALYGSESIRLLLMELVQQHMDDMQEKITQLKGEIAH